MAPCVLQPGGSRKYPPPRNCDRTSTTDRPALSYQLKKRDYSLDEELIREYFPADFVISGVFDIYSELLGVHFTEVKEAQVWSPDVKLYRIDDSKENRLVGYFYTDFFPRSAKYGHAAAFPLISGRSLSGGNYSAPV